MPDTRLYDWLSLQHMMFLSDVEYRPEKLEGPFGTHGCSYGVDNYGYKFVIIGFNMPPRIFAEIEDGTHGNLQGWRIYYDPTDQTDI